MDLFAQLDRYLARYLSPAVRIIFLINCGAFLFFAVLNFFGAAGGPLSRVADLLVRLLANDPALSVGRGMIWQFVSYMFLHFDPLHLIFNMFILWFFAPALERRWGTMRFWNFYLVVGAGAGFLYALLTFLSGRAQGPVIGASGALYGVLLAFAAYYPNSMVYVWGIFPIAMKYLVGIIILFDFIAMRNPASNVSHLTHMTGLAVAFFYLSRYHRTSDLTRWRYLR